MAQEPRMDFTFLKDYEEKKKTQQTQNQEKSVSEAVCSTKLTWPFTGKVCCILTQDKKQFLKKGLTHPFRSLQKGEKDNSAR